MRAKLYLLTAGVFAAALVPAAAQATDEIAIRPYFGAAYERGSLKFKNATLYGEDITGYAPTVGVAFGKYFALETSWRMAYGTGQSVPGTSTVTTTQQTVVTAYTTSYHTSSAAFGLDLLVRFPLGNTGLAPFVLTGVAIGKLKEVTQTDSTITTTLTGSTTPKTTYDTAFQKLVGKMEVCPELGIGLAYGYGDGELRVMGRIQNANMGNSGQYLLTLSAGLLLKM